MSSWLTTVSQEIEEFNRDIPNKNYMCHGEPHSYKPVITSAQIELILRRNLTNRVVYCMSCGGYVSKAGLALTDEDMRNAKCPECGEPVEFGWILPQEETDSETLERVRAVTAQCRYHIMDESVCATCHLREECNAEKGEK